MNLDWLIFIFRNFKFIYSEKAKKFGAIVLKVLTLISNVKTLNFCGLLSFQKQFWKVSVNFIEKNPILNQIKPNHFC